MLLKYIYLENVTKAQCQHITEDKWKYLPHLLQQFEELFDVILGKWKTGQVYSNQM